MFCPTCRDEFSSESHRCPSCEIPLESSLAAPRPPRLVQVLESVSHIELELAKSILESMEILSFLKGGSSMMLTDAVVTGTVWVPEDRAEEALEALKPLKEGISFSAEESSIQLVGD